MANALMVEGQLYDWLLQHGYTSDEHAHALASLVKRSGIAVPKRDGKLLNFFEDRPRLFGIVKGSDEAENRRIYAIPREREGNRGRDHPRGRGGPGRYVRSQEAQELLDAQEQELLDAQEQELLDAQMLNDAIRPNLSLDYPPQMTEYNNRHNMHSPFFVNAAHKKEGGKSKSKSRSTRKSKTARKSRRKSRSRKNRNRRNKTARN